MSEQFIQWSIGAVLVMTYAVARFNTPRSNRFSTTRARYYLSLGLYLAAVLLVFSVLGVVLEIPAYAELFQQSGIVGADTALALPGPLLSALLMTTLVGGTRLGKLDHWMRERACVIGNIPSAARQLAAQLRGEALEVPMLFRDAMRDQLTPLTDEDIRWLPDGSVQHLWTRITALYTIASDWQNQSIPKIGCAGEAWSEQERRRWARYEQVGRVLATDFDHIGGAYVQVRKKVISCFALSHAYQREDPAVSECFRHVHEALIPLHEDLSLYIARGVLLQERTQHERLLRLRGLGFRNLSSIVTPRLSANDLVGVGVALFLIVVMTMLITRYLSGLGGAEDMARGDEPHRVTILFKGMMIAVIYTMAIVAGTVPRTIVPWFRREGRARPWLGYMASGFAAMVMALCISILFRSLYLGDVASALEAAQFKYPWLYMSFATAFGVAFLADDNVIYREGSRLGLRTRLGEGAVLALVLALVFFSLVHPELTRLYHEAAAYGARADWLRLPGREPVLAACAAIGFVIGFYVPHSCRMRPSTGTDGVARAALIAKGQMTAEPAADMTGVDGERWRASNPLHVQRWGG